MPNYVMNRITINTDEKTLVKMLKAFKNEEQLKEQWPEGWEIMTESGLVTTHPTIDFNKVIPMPDSLSIESGSSSDRGLDWWLWANRRELDAGERSEPALSDEDYSKVLNYPRYGGDFDEKIKSEDEIAKIKEYGKDEKIRDIGTKAAHNIIDYDAATWYEWRNQYWGTKWNSCEAQESSGKYEIKFTTAWTPAYKIAEELSKQYPEAIISIVGADEFAPAVFPAIMYVDGEEMIISEEDENEELWSDLWGYSCKDEEDGRDWSEFEDWFEFEDDESEEGEDADGTDDM